MSLFRVDVDRERLVVESEGVHADPDAMGCSCSSPCCSPECVVATVPPGMQLYMQYICNISSFVACQEGGE